MSEGEEPTTTSKAGESGRKGKGLFALPPLSEIKKANRVSVISTKPALFNSNRQRRRGNDTERLPPPPPPASKQCALVSTEERPPEHSDDISGELCSSVVRGLKRARDETDNEDNVLQKRAHSTLNERVLPKSGNTSHEPSLVEANTCSSTAASGTGPSGMRPSGMGASGMGSSGMGPSGMGASGMGSSGMRPSGMGSSGMGPSGMGFSGAGAVTVSEAVASTSTSTILPSAHHPHAIIANIVQKKNPVMKHIRNVPWELGDVVPDFVLGKTTCAMFLSVRYHSLHPNYIHTRLKELGRQYQLRLLLVLVDMKECQKALQELAKIAILADLTLMLAWSYEEAGRYLETYKAFENKPPDILMERIDSDFFSRSSVKNVWSPQSKVKNMCPTWRNAKNECSSLRNDVHLNGWATECLTTVKKVNKTDAATLLNNFKALDKVITASRDELVLCPGLGPQKAQRLFTLFHQPFKTSKQ